MPIFLVLLLVSGAFADENYIVAEGDTLWAIAKIFYSNPLKWEEIYKANSEKIKDPHIIYPQQVLVLPGVPRASEERKALEEELEVAPPRQVLPQASEMPIQPVVPLPGALTQSSPTEIIEPQVQPPKKIELSSEAPPEAKAHYDGTIVAAQEKKVLYAQGDRMIINLGLRDGLVNGDELRIVRRTYKRRDSRSKKMLWQFQEIGRLKILAVRETDAEVEIIMSHDPVAIGDGVLKKK